MKTPHFILFEEPSGKGGTPLFKNQTDLVEKIMTHEGTGYKNKNPMTLRSTISHVITGERNLSKGLREVIFLVVKDRLDVSKQDFKRFQRDLTEAAKRNYEERLSGKRKNQVDKDFHDLLEATNKAKNLLIITFEPAELRDSPEAGSLKRELLEKIGVISNPDATPAKYRFYLPKDEVYGLAQDFWRRLRDFAVEETGLGVKEIEHKLLEANKDQLRVFVVDETEEWLAPFVFCDYENVVLRRGFCVLYNRPTPSVSELTLKVMTWWFRIVYPKISDPARNSAIEEFSFNKLLH